MIGGRQLTSSLCTESSHRATQRCSSPAAVIQQLGCCAIPTNRELSGGGGGGGGGLLLNCRTEEPADLRKARTLCVESTLLLLLLLL